MQKLHVIVPASACKSSFFLVQVEGEVVKCREKLAQPQETKKLIPIWDQWTYLLLNRYHVAPRSTGALYCALYATNKQSCPKGQGMM